MGDNSIIDYRDGRGGEVPILDGLKRNHRPYFGRSDNKIS